MRRAIHIGGILLSALILLPGAAQASTITFTGQDDGAPTSGPFPLSAAAQSSFDAAAAAFGGLTTLTFESQATGYYSPIAVTGASITLTGPDFGAGFSGISNVTDGNLYGFNTTPSGANWLGFAGGSATFTFSSPTHSFGLWLTGLQTVFSDTTGLAITFNDGSAELLNPPINSNGGAEFFGFTDTNPFSSITLTDTSNDAWGVDDVQFNGSSATPVPEPGTLGLLATGLFGVARRYRQRRS